MVVDMDLKEEAWQVEVRNERFEGYLATVSLVYVSTVVDIHL